MAFHGDATGLSMISITTNAGKAAKTLADLRKRFPREYERAMITASMGLKKQARKALTKSGTDPLHLAPLAKETRDIRKARGGSGGRKLAGVLGSSIKSYAKRGIARIGWPAGLRSTGQMYQSKSYHKRRPQETALLKRWGLAEPAEQYRRPARKVWQPFSRWSKLPGYVADVVAKRIRSILDKP